MKRILILTALFIMGNLTDQGSVAVTNITRHGSGMHFGYFYSSLSPHGEWIEIESGFHVWRPHRVGRYWRPYSVGQWVWTSDYGWYWMSNESFGWITYHYGRWYCDDYYGWIWVPDDVWGPAWVEWRYDDDYIGWAPLPPYATFRASIGIHFTNHWAAPARYWNFVRYHRFGNALRYRDTEPESHTRRLIRTTRSGYRYGSENDRVINHGVDRTIIERQGRIKIQNVAVQEDRTKSGERMIRTNNSRTIERIEIYHPTRDEMERTVERTDIKRGDRALSIDMKKIERRQSEPRTPSDQREQTGIETRQPERTIQREPQQEGRQGREIQSQSKETKPRLQRQNRQLNQQQKRQELIQRHENRQNPSPPVKQQVRQQRVQREQQSRQTTSSTRSTPQRSSERSRKR